jgi:hypothetical protein
VGGWSTPRPGRRTPGKGPRYPLYRRLAGRCRLLNYKQDRQCTFNLTLRRARVTIVAVEMR